MAEINVQEKKASIWPWVIGLILLAGLVWMLMEMMGGEDDPIAMDEPTTVTAPVGAEMQTTDPLAGAEVAAVEEYMGECASVAQTTAEMSLTHDYTVDCIRLLSGALASVVERDAVGRTLESTLNEFRQTATEMQATPETSPNHSSMLRDVAVSAADLMARVHEARMGEASTPELIQARTAAEAIRSEVPLMDQQREAGEFFREAGEALRMLSQG